MRINFTLFKYDIQVSQARQPWSHFRIHHTECGRHLVFGKVSIMVEDWTLEVHPICAECGSASIGEVRYGDEGLTVCQSCQSVEQGYKYVNLREYEHADCL